MADRSSNSIDRLLAAIGYPERASDGSSQFTLRVDGAEVVAEETGGRIVLSYALGADEGMLPRLAAYAAGRMLREDAALAYGSVQTSGPSGSQAFLWQDVSAGADAHAMLRLFETFMDSCDWWRARVDALHGDGTAAESAHETMMILP